MLGTYALSSGYYDAYYVKAQKVRTLIKRDFDEAWDKVDAIVAPTSPTVAFPLGARTDDPYQMYLADVFTIPANMAGIPGVAIPCGFSDGLPVWLQILGHFHEATFFESPTPTSVRDPGRHGGPIRLAIAPSVVMIDTVLRTYYPLLRAASSMAEQLTLNQLVEGSSPSRLTKETPAHGK